MFQIKVYTQCCHKYTVSVCVNSCLVQRVLLLLQSLHMRVCLTGWMRSITICVVQVGVYFLKGSCAQLHSQDASSYINTEQGEICRLNTAHKRNLNVLSEPGSKAEQTRCTEANNYQRKLSCSCCTRQIL